MSKVAPDDGANKEVVEAEEKELADGEKSTDINDYCANSLMIFGRDSGIRVSCFNACVSTNTMSFDNFILFFILLNALFMMLVNLNTDFECFDGAEPQAKASNSNCAMIAFVDNCELMFTTIFLIEFIVKVIAYGFICEKNTYMTDMWCQLDFVIVASSIITLTPLPLPNVGFLRSFRVLRPLKSLSKFPELKVIISAVTSPKAAQQLGTVMIMLMFVVTIFAIVGLEFFQGYDHYRCRLTAWPVAYNASACLAVPIGEGTTQNRPPSTADCWGDYLDDIIANHEANPEKYACRDKSGNMLIDELEINDPSWKLKSDSPWYTGVSEPHEQGYDCIWPVDHDDGRLCSADKGSGAFHGIHKCHGVAELSDPTDASSELIKDVAGGGTCGSNYDLVGNRRFKDTNWEYCSKPENSNECNPYGYSRMDYGTFDGDLNWGFPNYDYFGAAFMTVFQSVTEEGWVDIMYPLMDAFSPFAVVTTFMLMMMLGSVLMMNMFLAVIAESVDDAQDEADAEAEEAEAAEAAEAEKNAPPDEEGGEEVDDHGRSKSFVSKSRRKIEAGENVGPFRKMLLAGAQSDLFNNFILVCIGLNTVVLALDRVDQGEAEAEICEIVNLILTFIFIFEMVFMLAAKGRKVYFADGFNVFDFVVVWISIAELILVQAGVISGAGVSALRAARIFRVFKMAKDWAELQKLLNTMGSTLSTIGPFCLLLAIFVYIFALIGMKMFANQMHFDPDTEYRVDWVHVKAWDVPDPPDDFDKVNFYWPAKYDPDRPTYVPRSNFDDFGKACITIFQVLTGENWNAVMYDCRRSKKPEDAYLAYAYFMLLMFMGGFVVMNLFLGILLAEFEGNEEFSGASEGAAAITGFKSKMRATMSSMAALKSNSSGSNGSGVGFLGALTSAKEAQVDPKEAEEGPAESEEEKPAEAEKGGEGELEENNSLFIFSQTNPVRVACRDLVTRKWFDNTIVGVIVVSSLCLAIENPLDDPDGGLAAVLKLLDTIATIIFIIECVAKIITGGFLMNGPKSYLRDSWNILDFVIVVISVVDFASGGNMKALKAVRTVRVLKPLRMINKYPELKLVINALISSIPQTFNVFAILMIVLLLFGIIGVNLFKGKFHMCDDGDGVLSREQNEFMTWPPMYTPDHLTTYSDITDPTHLMWLNASCPPSTMDEKDLMTSKVLCGCMLGEGADDDSVWADVVAPRFNFDNILNSMALLFEITSTEGWVDIMQAAADTRAWTDMQPVTNESEGLSYFYFLIWMFVGAFFIVQVVVAVLCDQFERIKTENEEKGQGLFTTIAQQQWKETLKWAMKLKPKKKLKPVVVPIFEIFDPFDGSRLFEQFIMACILINTFTMALKYIEMPDDMLETLNICNLIFAAIFTIEMVLKLLALGWTQYIRDAWNKFDFIIVIGTLAGIIVEATGGIALGSVASIVRMFRIGRILRLTKSMPEMRRIFESIISALPSMMNVMGLLGIFLFISSALAVQLFAKLELKEDFNEHGNFQDFGVAMLTLVRFLTGENWNGVLHHMVDWNDGESCEVDPDWQEDWCRSTAEWIENCRPLNGCGDRYAVYIFMYAYLFLAPMVVFNLFVGIVLEAFDKNDENEDATLTTEQCENFRDTWAEFTEEQHLCVSKLKDFMQILHAPMGFGKDYVATDVELEEEIKKIHINVVEENIAGKSMGDEFEIDMKDIAEGLAKRVQRKAAEEEGDEEKLKALNFARTDPMGEKRLKNRGLVTAQPWIQSFFDSRRPKSPGAAVGAGGAAAEAAATAARGGVGGTGMAIEDMAER